MTGTRKRPAASSEEWEKLDVKAQEIIVTRMEEGSLVHLLSCGHPMRCERSCFRYTRRNLKWATVHLLQQKFFAMENKGESISVFISRLEEIRSQLRQMGEDISESMFITKVLMSLPDKLKHFCIGLGIHGGWLSNIAGAHFETINRRGKDQFKWNGNSPGG